jgi:hypothetical protein
LLCFYWLGGSYLDDIRIVSVEAVASKTPKNKKGLIECFNEKTAPWDCLFVEGLRLLADGARNYCFAHLATFSCHRHQNVRSAK